MKRAYKESCQEIFREKQQGVDIISITKSSKRVHAEIRGGEASREGAMAARATRHACVVLGNTLTNLCGTGHKIMHRSSLNMRLPVSVSYASGMSSSAAEQAPSSNADGLKHTVLNTFHLDRGAKMVPFAGYSMPIQYSGDSIPESSVFCRTSAGLFDVSHMCGVSITGPDAIKYMHKVRARELIKRHQTASNGIRFQLII